MNLSDREPVSSQSVIEPSLDEVADHPWRLWASGELTRPKSGKFYETADPSTGKIIASVPDAGQEDVDASIEVALQGFDAWQRVAPRERAKQIRAAADVLRQHQQELAFLDAIDSGNPIAFTRSDVQGAAALMDMYCDWALSLTGQTIQATGTNLHYTVQEPYGVVARIVPFNHPLPFAAAKLAPPLLAGNCVVLKPAHQTPLSALRLGELIGPLFPTGVLTVLSGSGADIGDLLVRHPQIRRIAFTGSVRTGMAIQRAAAEVAVKTITLELGGKNAMIVFSDSDLTVAAHAAVAGMNFRGRQGQSCGSTSRVLVEASVADAFIQRVSDEVQKIVVGEALAESTEMGPLISDVQLARVSEYIDSGRVEGATLVTGGNRPAGLPVGNFLQPTVFANVKQSMRIAQEEIFGPVMSVLEFGTEAEALSIANEVRYGLDASLWTRDIDRAHRIAARLDVGTVTINGPAKIYPGLPFGGYKDSGIGREGSLEEVASFTQTKTVNVVLGN